MNPTKLVCSEKELSKLSVTFSETSLIEKPAKEDKPLLEAHRENQLTSSKRWQQTNYEEQHDLLTPETGCQWIQKNQADGLYARQQTTSN